MASSKGKRKKYRLIDRVNGIEIEVNSKKALEELLGKKFWRENFPKFYIYGKKKRKGKKKKRRWF